MWYGWPGYISDDMGLIVRGQRKRGGSRPQLAGHRSRSHTKRGPGRVHKQGK